MTFFDDSTNLYKIIDQAPLAMIAFDDGKIIFANQCAIGLMGYSDLESLKRQEHILKALQISRGENVSTFSLRDGDKIDLFLNVVTLNDDVKIAYLSKSFIETEQIDVNPNLSDLSRSRFMAGISHELKTPLNIMLNLYTLLEKTELSERQRDIIELSHDATETLFRKIQDILDFTSIRSKPITPDSVEFNPAKALEPLLQEISKQCHEKALKLELNINKNIDSIFIGVPDYIIRIARHLCDNAIKFTENGTIQINISSNKDEELIFEVTDTGIGIDEDTLKNIFNPFQFEKDPTTRWHGGISMGLALSQRMARLLGGEVKIMTNNKGGIIARFSLPLSKLSDDDAKGKNEILDVLVAEDNTTNQRVIKLILNQLGHNVTITKNGQECVERLEQQNFDVVLMDLHMPIMDGWTATKLIRDANNDIPIIALTADSRPEAKEMTQAVGMNGFLTKPLLVERLYDVLCNLQEKRHNNKNCGVLLNKSALN